MNIHCSNEHSYLDEINKIINFNITFLYVIHQMKLVK